MSKIQSSKMSKAEIISVIKATMTLLNNWNLTRHQKALLLGLRSASSLRNFESKPELVALNRDQIMRMSILMNIHEAIRVCFKNPENVNGFMLMVNQNPPFNGIRPIDMATRDMLGLTRTYEAIDAMQYGMWG
ncbi:hypothetical protein [Aliiglaciecola lipolytica]|uniref:Antitoxin Xre/MbcA/ParS-like toxin-binding domain-containing protein n=1 Tax=Aliiglaciecola lipolytica E3 TaxID=1127673 RepID=K6YCY4_9ALTE|nr:hypothetical protein [Aliiglaciecola lipolytica]GAC14498.1 hypothetical protein GLIP_1870 [Aliiglaciecola lipolytica E3]